MADINQFTKLLNDLGYDSVNVSVLVEPDYSLKKIKEFEVKYRTSSKDIINNNFRLQDKIPYGIIKEWLSYIDNVQYFGR